MNRQRTTVIRKTLIVLLSIAALLTACFAPMQKRFLRSCFQEWYDTNATFGFIAMMARYTSLDKPAQPVREIAWPLEIYRGAGSDEGLILDGWGNPIWLKPIAGESKRVRFVSWGSNGRDDGGNGDDVALELDLESFQTTWQTIRGNRFAVALGTVPLWIPFVLFAGCPVGAFVTGRHRYRKRLYQTVTAALAVLSLLGAAVWALSFTGPLTWDGGLRGMPTRRSGAQAVIHDGVVELDHITASERVLNCVPTCVPGQTCDSFLADLPPGWVLQFGGLRLQYERSEHECMAHGFTTIRVPLGTAVLLCLLLPLFEAVRLYRGPIREYRWLKAGLCGGCGYDLRANTSGACPECGRPRRPTVELHKGLV